MTPSEKIAEKEAEQKAAQAEARARALALSHDYKEVFGLARRRSEAQENVLRDLREKAGGSGSAFRPQGEGDGIKILLAGIQRDGARSLLDVIQYHLDQSSKGTKAPKPPPKVKK